MIYTYKKHKNLLDIINNNQDEYITYYNLPGATLPDYINNNIDNFRMYKNSLLMTVRDFKTNLNNKSIDISRLYTNIKIPKRKGGFREINAPSEELKYIQKLVTNFFSNQLFVYPHNSAQAYVKHRDTLTNAQIHQNNSMIVALDLKDFFTSINRTNLKRQLLKIGNICHTVSENELDEILDVCLLNEVLPQGSSASPLLSNLFMVEFDYNIHSYCKRLNINYTRYADDLFFSGEDIKVNALIIKINEVIQLLDLGIKINTEKTKILRPGKCYVTGVKINKEHHLTFGHEKKKELKYAIYNLFIKELNGTLVTEEVQQVLGMFSYASRIEPDYFDYLQKYYLNKFNSNHNKLTAHFKAYL